MQVFIYIFLGGGLGSLCRFALGEYFNQSDKSYSWGTMLANIVACFILGLIMGYSAKNNMDSSFKLLIATGFCGGFSTFSTFSAEVFNHINDGDIDKALIYISLSLLTGLIAVFMGVKLMQYL